MFVSTGTKDLFPDRSRWTWSAAIRSHGTCLAWRSPSNTTHQEEVPVSYSKDAHNLGARYGIEPYPSPYHVSLCCYWMSSQVEQLTCGTRAETSIEALGEPYELRSPLDLRLDFDLSGVKADAPTSLSTPRRRRCLSPGRTGALSYLGCPATSTSAAGRPYPPLPIAASEPNEFSRAFCGRLSRSSGRRVSTHGTWSFRRPIDRPCARRFAGDWTADGMSCPLRREHLIIRSQVSRVL